MRLIVAICVTLPEVALIVTCCSPAGVDVDVVDEGELDDEHPTTRPAIVRKRTETPRLCSFPLGARLRENARIEPNGNRTATTMPAAPLFREGPWTFAILPVVLIATFVVLTAVALTESELEENAHEIPTGPLQESATSPLKPLVGTTLTVAEVLEPSVTVAVGANALKPKVEEALVLFAEVIVANKP